MIEGIVNALTSNEAKGAFFATIFSLFTLGLVTALSAIARRKVKHFNELVSLDVRFNRHIDQMYLAIYTLEGVAKAHEKKVLSFNTIDSIRILPIEDYDSVLDLDLKNQLFSYDSGLERISSDLLNVASIYAELRSSVITKQLSMKEFFEAFPDLISNLNMLKMSLNAQIQEAILIKAQLRLMIKRDRGALTQIKLWVSSLGMKPLNKKDIDIEKVELLAEIEGSKKESRKQLDKLFGR